MSTQRESALTAPHDRNPERKFTLDTTTPPLTNEQVTSAMAELNLTTEKTGLNQFFPKVERRFFDPVLPSQQIGLFSFVPARGAKPDSKGVFGFMKLRGNYANETDANQRAEDLIRTDSYHPIYHSRVGYPVPITTSSDFSQETVRVDLQSEMSASIKEDIRKKREKEQQEIEEVKEREKKLLSDVKKTEEDPEDHYTTLRVKKAQLTWTYAETEKKMKQMAGLLAKARRDIEELDEKQPELKSAYMEKYMNARKQSGLPVDRDTLNNSFMKFLVEDLTIPAVDAEYDRMYPRETREPVTIQVSNSQ